MRYYNYRPSADEYAGVYLIGDDESVIDVHFDDAPHASNWSPVEIQDFRDNPELHGDFPSLSNYSQFPLCTQRAWDALRLLIGEIVEALPVMYKGNEPHYLIHVMNTIDALDENRSELTRSMIDGRVSRIYRYCFYEDRLKHHPAMFKLPVVRGAKLFVSEDFRRTVEEHGLKGLQFNPLPMVDDV